MSSGGLAIKHFCAKDHRFDQIKRSKLFQGLISWLTTSWVDDQVKWRCRLHQISLKKGGTSKTPCGRNGFKSPLGYFGSWVVGRGYKQPLNKRDHIRVLSLLHDNRFSIIDHETKEMKENQIYECPAFNGAPSREWRKSELFNGDNFSVT